MTMVSEQEERRHRAATALDMTHGSGYRGPKTFNARQRVAEALDLGTGIKEADLKWLEMVMRIGPAYDNFNSIDVDRKSTTSKEGK